MDVGPRKKLKSYRAWNCVLDLFFGTVLILLAMFGSIVFYSGCVSVGEYFHHQLKEHWELIALPIGIIWLYFNLKGIYYIVYMMLSKVQKEVVTVEKITMERVNTSRGSYRVWYVYHKDGAFELSVSESKELQEGQKVELWFKPERKGDARRNVAVYI